MACPVHELAAVEPSCQRTLVSPGAPDEGVTLPPRALGRKDGATTADAIERFEDLGEIDRGGTASVRLMFDRQLKRTVAAKRLRDDLQGNEELMKKLAREVQIAAQLQHPNIVAVHDLAFDARGYPYILMQHVRGSRLDVVLREVHDGQLDDDVLKYLVTLALLVCDAVVYAHDCGIVHGDIKPANILVAGEEQLFVADWGLAMSYRRSPAEPHDVASEHFPFGTPAYMAPEQASGRVDAIDPRTDVYGIGGVLYHMLTGFSPHEATDSSRALELARKGHVRPPGEVAIWKDLPAGLVAVTLKALAPNPGDRHQSVRELRDELRKTCGEHLPPPTWRFTRGNCVVRCHQEVHDLLMLVEGTCLEIATDDTQGYRLRRLNPGTLIGRDALLSPSRAKTTVIAMEDVVVRVVSREEISRELQRCPWLAPLVRGDSSESVI